jgi:hypothetical protein
VQTHHEHPVAHSVDSAACRAWRHPNAKSH